MPILPTDFTFGTMNSTATPPVNSDSLNQRSIWDIVWSCIMTIFACTWVAIHPNIPALSDTVIEVALRRAGLMICGLIAPEVIVLWAMRQWYGAREIGQRHNGQGWTTTHGFFLQMGGFVLYHGDKAIRPLTLEQLEFLHVKGYIEWPKITESEIQDRSKGDALSKGIVTLQTSWFLIQCIVRGSTGLIITELELLTLAFASLNVVTYFFWWNKPVDVRYPHPVHSNSGFITDRVNLHRGGNTDIQMPGGASIRIGEKRMKLAVWVSKAVQPLSPMMRGLRHMVNGIMGKTSISNRVSTFHAARISPDPLTFLWMTIACSALGSAFGGIHCIAWSFQFPSHQELMLWRTSSMVITCGPIFIALLSTTLTISRFGVDHGPGRRPGSYSIRWYFWFFMTIIQTVILVLSVVVYIAARLVLIIQAFMTLRALSPGALQAMEWTSFIPHF